mmetsp:Transcript_18855/g.44787  ORF Transcript_18855/g.44787 Transcript_18855/m.44787 type:complete len:305 (+) Transcript_18855:204-1118(+)
MLQRREGVMMLPRVLTHLRGVGEGVHSETGRRAEPLPLGKVLVGHARAAHEGARADDEVFVEGQVGPHRSDLDKHARAANVRREQHHLESELVPTLHEKHRRLEGPAGSPAEEALLAAWVVLVAQRLRGVADLMQRQPQVEPPLLHAGARHRLALRVAQPYGDVGHLGLALRPDSFVLREGAVGRVEHVREFLASVNLGQFHVRSPARDRSERPRLEHRLQQAYQRLAIWYGAPRLEVSEPRRGRDVGGHALVCTGRSARQAFLFDRPSVQPRSRCCGMWKAGRRRLARPLRLHDASRAACIAE